MAKLPDLPKDIFKVCYDEEYLREHEDYLAMCEIVWHHDAELIRKSIQDELQAQSDYESRADEVVNQLAKKVLLDIAKEEKVHQYELLEVLRKIDGFQKMAEEQAKREIEKWL